MRNDPAGLVQWSGSRSVGANPNTRRIIDNTILEIVPLRSAAAAIDALPPGSRVSVTASATRGQDATLELAAKLVERGHHAIPHLSARLMRNRNHVRDLAAWTRDNGVTTALVIGGDVTEPGLHHDALGLMRDLFAHDHGLNTVGVAAYPDGHPHMGEEVARTALFAKQELLAEAGLGGYCSTQMCFDAARITSWLGARRAEGLTLPVYLGVAGAVERTKLLTIGTRLGIGPSLRYLRKNRRSIIKLLGPTVHDPSELLDALGPRMTPLGIHGLHIFTFNQVEATTSLGSIGNK